MTFEFDKAYEEDRLKRLQIWLKENVVVIPEPQEVTLFDFEVNWASWRGFFWQSHSLLQTFYAVFVVNLF